MAATAGGRRRVSVRQIVAALAVGVAAAAPRAAEETSFSSGPELAERLLRNVVRISAHDLGEHGFGLIVGADERSVYVATARHVVAQRPLAGLAAGETPSRQIALRFCALPESAAEQPAEFVEGFDGTADDLALLRTTRPSGLAPEARALAPPDRISVGDQAWLLGREQQCALVPTSGSIGALPDERQNLRIDLHGVLGGSSGAPVATGYGVVGLAKRSDNEKLTTHAIADLRTRVRAAGSPFSLIEAGNVPPTDPRAAEIDLAETLNRYLFAVRDLHALLQQDVVPKPTFARLVERYSAAVDRFRTARDKYDGSLRRDWPDDVLPAWQRLRDGLWTVHLVFFNLNAEATRRIYESERSPRTVRQRMTALEPQLVELQDGIARFAQQLGKRRPPREQPTQ